MLDTKYRKALRILDGEINLYRNLHEASVSLIGTPGDKTYDGCMAYNAEKFLSKLNALVYLRKLLVNELGDL